jgi:peptide chain release factor 2
MGAPDFWTHQDSAQETVREVKQLKNWLDPFDSLVSRVDSARELADMLDAEPDAGMNSELGRDARGLPPALAPVASR